MKRAVSLLAVCSGFALLVSCGGDDDVPATPCTPSTCPSGCCLQGQCVVGNTNDACGTSGAQCQTCSSGQTCSGQSCTEACNSVSCSDGCCGVDGECVTPPTSSACGVMGRLCEVCGEGYDCVLGQCAPAQPGCTECPGCCLDDTCMPGNTTQACGTGGGTCTTCPEDNTCNNGVCEPVANPCDAVSCEDGCCAGNQCIPFSKQDLQACGKGGEPCNVCEDAAVSCSQGTCVVDQTCASFCKQGCCDEQDTCVSYVQQDVLKCGDEGDACAPCTGSTGCYQGQCISEPTWEVWALSAEIAPKKADGSDWDNSWISNPNPDPFFKIGPSWAKWYYQFDFSSTINNHLSPQWNEKVAAWQESALVDPTGVIFGADDDDAGYGGFNDLIGVCNVVLTPAILQAGSYTIPTCGDGITNLKVKFVKQ